MAVPRISQDGAQAYGVTIGSSGVVTINGIAYKVNSVTPTRNVETARDKLPDGGNGRQRWTADFDEADMELQLATSSTAPPQFGQTFSMTLDANYGSELWNVMPNSPEQTNDPGAIRVAQIRISHRPNGSENKSTGLNIHPSTG